MSSRLSKAEIAQLKARFQEWQTPNEMSALEDSVHGRIGPDVHLNQAGLGFLHDAIIASDFSKIFRPSALVRLCKATRPDFEMRLPDQSIFSAEATLANLPGRKMGEEYRGLPHPAPVSAELFCPYEAEAQCREFGPGALMKACEKKIAKDYSRDVALVIYFNFDVIDRKAQEKIAGEFFLSATEAAKDHFRDVFVLWGSSVSWLWQSGRARNRIRRPEAA